MKSSKEIRQDFIDFFKSKEHLFVRSAPVVPQDDPTLLFTNAGMNQFKAIFLGENKEGWKRAANSQKCMRVSGKHNDLDEVGRDHHHHTFFEMLGNWSFGDYYKKEAIQWAWELLTEVWQLPKERLFVTIYKDDDEAGQLWSSVTDIEPRRILRFDEKDNFWEMGDTGPCGPCSEIHYDMGDLATQEETFADPVNGVNGENDRYREIWNLVFMQNNRAANGSLSELPAKNVDTGMGFERIVTVLQDVQSNYDTDLFAPIISELSTMSGVTYSTDEKGTPFRVIADHIRALTFAITDGAFPSNEGRGYVLRRILRRASRFGRELGFKEAFLYKLVPVVIRIMGEAFPEIGQRNEYIQEVIKSEEERFIQTLEQGIEKFNQLVEETKKENASQLSGEAVFVLYDTFGFPDDLTRIMAEEKGLRVDEKGFAAQMKSQRERARAAQKKGDTSGLTPEGWTDITTGVVTDFIGYEKNDAEVHIYRYKTLTDQKYLMCLDETPFYAESGGQIGDTGILKTSAGTTIKVLDTIKWNDTIVHQVEVPHPLMESEITGPLKAEIDIQKRAATRRNHTATHLLQAALREELGDHVQQQGSRVSPEGLRFDFTHFKALTPQEIQNIERRVNDWILSNYSVQTEIKELDEAKAEGATALFGEKYGDRVRVVQITGVSKELCGGTHVHATGDIGLFHIVAESSISAGNRRIEAITGTVVLDALQRAEGRLSEVAQILKIGPEKIVGRITDILASVKDLESKVKELSSAASESAVDDIITQVRDGAGGLKWLVKDLGESSKDEFTLLADGLSDYMRDNPDQSLIIVLGANVGGKALFAAAATKKAVKENQVHCGNLVREAAKKAGGGGGGSPVRAQAGGKDVTKIGAALQLVESMLS